MNEVDVSLIGGEPACPLKNLEVFIKKLMDKVGLNGYELSVVLCNDEEIKRLNEKYRKKNSPTDVLSFSQLEGNKGGSETDIKLLGDIVVSLETVKRNASANSISYEEELKRVIIHGLLHLLGFKHDESDLKISKSPMILKQEKILKEMMEEKLF